MTPLPFVWPFAPFFWGAYLWAFYPEFRLVARARRERTAADSRSLQVILLGMWLAYLLAFPLAWIRSLQFNSSPAALFVIGLLVLIAGSLLRRHCWSMLGASFTGDVRAHADQQIITRGAYRWLRHPSYSGGLLMNSGIGIALGSWGSTALLFLVSLLVYCYRMNVEERVLLATVGEPYRDFMRGRKRIVPFIY